MKLDLSLNLAEHQADALDRVNKRLMHGAVYATKAIEAERVLAGASSEHAPLLAAEADLKGIALADLAAEVRRRHVAAATALLPGESKRQRLQAKIRGAATPIAIEAAVAELWQQQPQTGD